MENSDTFGWQVAAEVRRVKGSEKFWLTDGAEAILQLRAAQLSDDDPYPA